jgi:ABC-type lipoprotein release transport system permease subunit
MLAAVGAGLLLGGIGARVSASLVSRLVAGASGVDLGLLAVAAAVLAGVAAAATLVPAWRGVRLDPAVALRED